MELAMIGLGRMGGNMTDRLLRGGHRVVAYDLNAVAVDRAAAGGAIKAGSLEAVAQLLKAPRVIWIMLPAGKIVDETLNKFAALLSVNDIVVDGGNSYYKDTLKRAASLSEKGLHYVDVGTSGGIWGDREGYCLMIGGPAAVVGSLRPIFETLAPAADKGWAHVGPAGAGHFVKMVHNGIEYGDMQLIAEAYDLLRTVLGMKAEELSTVFEEWNKGELQSFLIEITAKIFRRK